MLKNIIIFLIFNFAALAIGGAFTGKGVPSEWYLSLHKAPWTPPGWVFGFAWTTIMICYAIFMSYLIQVKECRTEILILFVLQWLLNVAWNPVFFYFHWTIVGLVFITLLTIVVVIFTLKYLDVMHMKTILILPYLVWLLIATSLNAYIVLNN